MSPSVRRLRRTQIDDRRWDAAVMRDAVPLPYGLSWWLDAATDHAWEGLVLDDYRVVLPLPIGRRFGVLPVYLRPPYTQQLGPFGQPQRGDVGALLRAVPPKLQVALPLRPTLPLAEVPRQYRVRRRTNYVLDLSRPYAETKRGFPKKLQQYLMRCSLDELAPIDAAALVAMSRSQLTGRQGVSALSFGRLTSLIEACCHRGLGKCYQLKVNQECLGAGFYPQLEGRTINLVAVTTEAGRKQRGMSRLLSLVFALQSGQPGATFDFEGSELPGVREFFAKFGGTDEGYYLLRKGLLS